MLVRLSNALRRDRKPASADEPIRRFVETLEALEARRPRAGGGRVRALDLFAHSIPRQPRSDP